MTDLILATVSAAGAWLYAVIAIAVWRAATDRESDGLIVAAVVAVWVLAVGIPATLLALTLTLRLLPKTPGLLAVTAIVTVLGGGIVTGCILTSGGEREVAAVCWPLAAVSCLLSQMAVLVARATVRVASVAVAPARLVGRKRVGAEEREARIAAIERELGL